MHQLESQPAGLPAFRAERVSLQVGPHKQQILTDISFTLVAGECLGLIGASGAGKTTLLRLLNRLQEPSSGEMFLREQNIRQLPPVSLRQRVMLVPQEPKLLGMTVRQALLYPLQLQKIPAPEQEHRLQQCLERLGIPEDWLGRAELQLSVGQRQWVCLGRALMAEPEVLLLDEPTAALDVGRSQMLLELLRQLEGTVLLASHQLDLVEQFCQRVLWLDAGKLRQQSLVAAMDWQQVRQTLQEQQQAALQEWQ